MPEYYLKQNPPQHQMFDYLCCGGFLYCRNTERRGSCLFPVGEILHELCTFEGICIRVASIEHAFELADCFHTFAVHPLINEVCIFLYDGRAVLLERAAALYSRSSGKDCLYDTFGRMNTTGGCKVQLFHCCRSNARPAQGLRQVCLCAEYIA